MSSKIEEMPTSVDFELQFEFYLKKCGLSKTTLSKIQYDEMLKAFVAGWTQMFALLAGTPSNQMQNAFQEIEDNLRIFWSKHGSRR